MAGETETDEEEKLSFLSFWRRRPDLNRHSEDCEPTRLAFRATPPHQTGESAKRCAAKQILLANSLVLLVANGLGETVFQS